MTLPVFLTFLIIGGSIVLLGVNLYLGLNGRGIPFLADQTPRPLKRWPRLSILVAARNEEESIEGALLTLLALDYPDYQIIAVNDRSTDATGSILERMAIYNERLQVLSIESLPEGWLGKNHALHRAASIADGELLLFTDADVHFRPLSLRCAVRYLLDHHLKHLTILPEVSAPGLLLETQIALFSLFFFLHTRPWLARNPKSKAHIGIGAFNLIDASFYHWIGGHQAIAMRPDDDLKLGRLVKLHSGRQRLLFGEGMLRVRWYASLPEMIVGLEKNLFAGADYRLLPIFAGTIFIFVAQILPYCGILFGSHPVRIIALAAVASTLLLFGLQRKPTGGMTKRLLLYPLCALIFGYILWRSTLLALIRGGIHWRDTFYPLHELKKNRLD